MNGTHITFHLDFGNFFPFLFGFDPYNFMMKKFGAKLLIKRQHV